MAPSKVLAGARTVLPTGIVDDGRVLVEGTRITATGDATRPTHSPTGPARPARPPSTSPGTGWSPASSTCTTTAAAAPPSPPARPRTS